MNPLSRVVLALWRCASAALFAALAFVNIEAWFYFGVPNYGQFAVVCWLVAILCFQVYEGIVHCEEIRLALAACLFTEQVGDPEQISVIVEKERVDNEYCSQMAADLPYRIPEKIGVHSEHNRRAEGSRDDD